MPQSITKWAAKAGEMHAFVGHAVTAGSLQCGDLANYQQAKARKFAICDALCLRVIISGCIRLSGFECMLSRFNGFPACLRRCELASLRVGSSQSIPLRYSWSLVVKGQDRELSCPAAYLSSLNQGLRAFMVISSSSCFILCCKRSTISGC
jgi:hypothetical protein